MRRALVLAPLALFAATFGTADAQAPPNPFAGSWAGTYTSTGTSAGDIEFTVEANGILRGSLVDNQFGVAILRGAVLPSSAGMPGAMGFAFHFIDFPELSWVVLGTASIVGGDLHLTVSPPTSGSSVFTAVLTPQ